MVGKRVVWRVLVLAILVAGPSAVATAWGQQPQKPASDEFLPIDQLPPGEQLPAAPLLIAAYSVVWILVAGYLFSIWKRLGSVERDIAELSRRLPQRKT